eukprot:scaffold232220_cov36-Tisochrysis_lutea.AAC.7
MTGLRPTTHALPHLPFNGTIPTRFRNKMRIARYFFSTLGASVPIVRSPHILESGASAVGQLHVTTALCPGSPSHVVQNVQLALFFRGAAFALHGTCYRRRCPYEQHKVKKKFLKVPAILLSPVPPAGDIP